jgi:hypothetical protein
VAIITKGPTSFDGVAGVRLDGDVEAEMERLLGALGVTA